MLKRFFNKKALGKKGEDRAERFLKGLGYRILHRNYRCPIGEIDIVAQEGKTLVFVEVKTRTTHRFGTPIESVDWKKRERLKRLALYYIKNHFRTEPPVRFDIIGVSMDGEIEHLKGAF
ncbi:MAG: YraN family protein [Nitrospirae bacterium]|nr:MAG: YraN family protein [Nitrospirota bacterium]